MTRRERLVLLGVLAIAAYLCLSPVVFLAAVAQGYPSDLTSDPPRLAVVVAAEMAVVAALAYVALVLVLEGAYALQRRIRTRAGLDLDRPGGSTPP